MGEMLSVGLLIESLWKVTLDVGRNALNYGMLNCWKVLISMIYLTVYVLELIQMKALPLC